MFFFSLRNFKSSEFAKEVKASKQESSDAEKLKRGVCIFHVGCIFFEVILCY